MTDQMVAGIVMFLVFGVICALCGYLGGRLHQIRKSAT